MTPELHKYINDFISTIIPVIVLFIIGVITATWLQQWVISRWRNGNGNRRKNDKDWPTQLLVLLGQMDQKLNDIHETLNNELKDEIRKMSNSIENFYSRK